MKLPEGIVYTIEKYNGCKSKWTAINTIVLDRSKLIIYIQDQRKHGCKRSRVFNCIKVLKKLSADTYAHNPHDHFVGDRLYLDTSEFFIGI